jgi:hypothetical protein
MRPTRPSASQLSSWKGCAREGLFDVPQLSTVGWLDPLRLAYRTLLTEFASGGVAEAAFHPPSQSQQAPQGGTKPALLALLRSSQLISLGPIAPKIFLG